MLSSTPTLKISSALSGLCFPGHHQLRTGSTITLPPVRYDAHPMAILTSAFAYLGSYYSEANPSLQGKVHITRRPF